MSARGAGHSVGGGGGASAMAPPPPSFPVPDMSPLLAYGTVPSLENFDLFLGELDRLLEENSRKLDTTVTDILRITNELPNMTRFGSPTESLDHMIHSRALDHAGCNPRPSDVSQFLNKILKLLEKNQGCEDSLLQTVLKMASAEGLTLPLKATTDGSSSLQSPPDDSSFTSKSTLDSSAHGHGTEQMTCDGLWNEVSARFRRHYVERLQSGMSRTRPTAALGSTPEVVVEDHRLHSLQSLCALYPAYDVWTKYCSLRQQHLSRVISDHLSSSPYPHRASTKEPSAASSSTHHHHHHHLPVIAASSKKSSRSLARLESGDSGESSSSSHAAAAAASLNVLASSGAGGVAHHDATCDAADEDLDSLCRRFEETISIVVGYIQEDVSLMASSGIFRPIFPTFGAIRAIYYDAICASVKEVVRRILEAREKTAVENKDLLKSRSDCGILGSLRNSLRRGYGDHSRSMDSLTMAFVASTRMDDNRNSSINNNDKEDSSPVDCDADEATPLTLSRANEDQMRQEMAGVIIDAEMSDSTTEPNNADSSNSQRAMSHAVLAPVLGVVTALLGMEAHLDRMYVEAEGDFLPGTAGNTGHSALSLARGAAVSLAPPKGVLKPAHSHPDLTYGAGGANRSNDDGVFKDDDDADNEGDGTRRLHPLLLDDDDDDDDDEDDTLGTPLDDSTLNTTTTSNGGGVTAVLGGVENNHLIGDVLYDFSNSTVEADSSLEDYFQLNVLPTLKVKSSTRQRGSGGGGGGGRQPKHHHLHQKSSLTVGQRNSQRASSHRDLTPQAGGGGGGKGGASGGSESYRGWKEDLLSRPVLEWRSVFGQLIPDLAWSVEHLMKRAFLQTLDAEEEAYEEACDGAGGACTTFQMRRICVEMLGRAASADGAAPVADGDVERIFDSPVSFGSLDLPRFASSNVVAALELVDRLVPLAQAGSEGSVFQIVRSSFVDNLVINVKKVISWFRTVVNDWPEKCPTRCALQIVGSASVLAHHLFHLLSILSSSSTPQQRSRLEGVFDECRSFLRDVEEYILTELSSQFATCLLLDIDGQKWEDSKSFYEDERCSYAVQTWALHLQGLSRDLWNFTPSSFASRSLATLLDSSTSSLAQRYARVRPSYRRLGQFRADCTVVLATLSDLLFRVSPTCAAYLHPVPSHHSRLSCSIHANAALTFASLVVVSAPLKELYRAFKKGYRHRLHNLPTPAAGAEALSSGGVIEDPTVAPPPGSRKIPVVDPSTTTTTTTTTTPTTPSLLVKGSSRWLAAIRPELLLSATSSASPPESQGEMQTCSAIVLHLKLLSAQPAPSWPLVVQALLLKDYALAIVLLSQPDVGVEAPRRHAHPTVVDNAAGKRRGNEDRCGADGGSHSKDAAISRNRLDDGAASGCGGAFCCWEWFGSGAATPGVSGGASSAGSGDVPFICSSSSSAASQSIIRNPCRSFLHVLMQHSPHDLEVFAKVLVPVINNTSTWHVLDSKAMPGRSFAVPNWLDAVYLLLRPIVVQVVAPALQSILAGRPAPSGRGRASVGSYGVSLPSDVDMAILCSTLTDLPCGCKPAFHDTAKAKHVGQQQQKNSVDGLLHHRLQLLFERLASVSMLLPAPIAVFCVAAQRELGRVAARNLRDCASTPSSLSSQPTKKSAAASTTASNASPPSPARGSVGVQLLVGAVFKYLCDATFVESVTRTTELRSATRDTLRLLAECFFHAATEDDAGAISTTTASADAVAKKRNVPKQTVTFLRSSWDWLPSHLDAVVSNVDQISAAPSFDLEPPSNVPAPVRDLYDDAASEALAYQIRETQEGRFALRYIFDVLTANRTWIERHFDLGAHSQQPPTLFSSSGGATTAFAGNDSRAPLRLVFDGGNGGGSGGAASGSGNNDRHSTSSSPDFNPFRHFNVISGSHGVDVNDDKLVRNFSYDWKAILDSGGVELGLTETGFRHLLRNRPEMQDGAHLTEMERKQAAVLKAVFDLDPSEAM